VEDRYRFRIFILVLSGLLRLWIFRWPNRKAISGKVTVDGVAVPNGSVSFEPLSTSGVGSGAVITDGKYFISKADELPAGKYLARITGDDGKSFGVSAGKMPGPNS